MYKNLFGVRLAIGVVTSLLISLLSLIPLSTATATPVVSSTSTTNPLNDNEGPATLAVNTALIVSPVLANTAVTNGATQVGLSHHIARSVGLIAHNGTDGASATATVRPGGVLSLYSKVSTTTAISATGGTLSSATGVSSAANRMTITTGTDAVSYNLLSATSTGTTIAVLWTAPTTSGTYNVILSASNALTQEVSATSPTLGGFDASIIVTVTPTTQGTGVSLTASNTRPLIGAVDNSLFTAVALASGGVGVLTVATDVANAHISAKSLGLLSKDSSVSTAQTATILTSGVLSLYANVSTNIAFVATGGTFGLSPTGAVPTFNQTRQTLLMTNGAVAATAIGVAWTAPSTAGTYTISMYNGASGTVDLDTPARTLGAAITVTVVAASAGGSYSAVYSACRIENSGSPTFGITSNVDDTAYTGNTGTIYVEFTLKDAYNANLDSGNIVATATNGALLAYANGGAVGPGTASTVVAYDGGSADAIRINQPTSNVPVSTTVTITYNGTAVCTKSFAIGGEVAKLAVNVTDVQDLSGSTGKANFLDDGWAPASPRAGHFTVYATDSAGNPVATSSIGTYAVNAASLAGQTIVTALSVDSSATVTSSTSPGRLSTGTYTCGATAGEVKTVKIDFTNTSSGKVVTSDAFALRCADNPYSFTASFDKASYVQGEIATLTVKFLDSKGNPANSSTDTGPWTGTTPMLTNISTTGAAGGLDKNGEKKFTYTVGTTSGVTAGTYTAVINYTTLTGAGTATTQTPTYKVSTGGDTTSNADILKSIVALIASINKQIQALQKLILKR